MEASSLVYIILTVVTVCFALSIDYKPLEGSLLSVRKNNKFMTNSEAKREAAFLIIFILLFAVSALRVAVGNDYWVYRDNFKLIAQDRHVSSEFGFNLFISLLVNIFGYDNYRPIFAVFSFITCAFLVKALKDQSEYAAFSLFLLLTNGFYFNSLNSVRYYLALFIALWAVKFIFSREYGKFIIAILFAACFHKTVLIVIPVYLFAWLISQKELKKIYYVIAGVGLVAVLAGHGLIEKLLYVIYPFYKDWGASFSLIGFAKAFAIVLFATVFAKDMLKEKPVMRFYYVLSVIGLMVYACGWFVPEVSRIAYYFVIFQCFMLPVMACGIKNEKIKNLMIVAIVSGYTLYFVKLLIGMYAINVRLLPYLNVIFN